jgi:hypothetical protein
MQQRKKIRQEQAVAINLTSINCVAWKFLCMGVSLQFIVSTLLLGRKTSAFAKGERDGWLNRDTGRYSESRNNFLVQEHLSKTTGLPEKIYK